MEVNGTLIWFYKICKREVWMMAHNILPDQKDENIDFGRFMHEHSFERNEKEVLFGNVRFDVIFKNENELVIGETKKTSKYQEASKYQLAFYLKVLKNAGIHARGQLLYPTEKGRVDIELTEDIENEINQIQTEIIQIAEAEKPPLPKKIPFCRNCGYKEYCFA